MLLTPLSSLSLAELGFPEIDLGTLAGHPISNLI